MTGILDNPEFWRKLSKSQLIHPASRANLVRSGRIAEDQKYFPLIISNGDDEIVLTITDNENTSYNTVNTSRTRNIYYTVFNFGDLFELHIEYCYLRTFEQELVPTGLRVITEELDFVMMGKQTIMGEPTTQADVDHYLTLLVLMVSK